MLIFRTKKVLVGLLCLMLLAVSAVHAQTSELRVGMPAVVELNPALGSNDPEIMFNRMIYDYLLDVAPDGSIVPQLASAYTISEDGLTYTLTLVEGVTFHDGSPLTSADVVWSFNNLKAAGSPALNLLGEFEVAADGDNSVVFTLAQPNADFLFGIASRWGFILKADTATPNVVAEGDNPYTNFVGT